MFFSPFTEVVTRRELEQAICKRGGVKQKQTLWALASDIPMKNSQQYTTMIRKKGRGLKGGQETPRVAGKIAAIALDEIRGSGRMLSMVLILQLGVLE